MFKVLTARLTVFFLACVWVLGLLAGGFTFFPAVVDLLHYHVVIPGMVWFLAFWYVVTVVLVSVWVVKSSSLVNVKLDRPSPESRNSREPGTWRWTLT